MSHDWGPAGRPLTIWPDEVDYWTGYVASLAKGSAAPIPVLSEHPGQTDAVLRAHGLPLRPPERCDPRFRSLGGELAALDDDIERLASLEARLRELAATDQRDDGAVIVGVGRMAKLGLVRAVADGRPFVAVESLSDLRAGTARSLYVTVDRLGPIDPVEVRQRVDREARREIVPGVTSCPVGYLTGRDDAMMTVLDAKQRLARPAGIRDAGKTVDVLIDCTLSASPGTLAEGLAAVPYRTTNRESLSSHEQIGLLAVTSHGMSDLIHLGEDYICGKSPYLPVTAPTGPLPSCQMPDGFCFFKPTGRPIAGHELPAEHVFVNSCGSLRFEDGDFDPLFAVWYSAIEGRARSFVGSVRWKDGHGLEGLLYRYLLRRGAPLGVAVELVNRALAGSQLEGESVYVLLGDPDERLAGVPSPGHGRAGETTEPQPWRAGEPVRLHDGWAHVAVDSPGLVRAFTDGQLLVHARGESGLFSGIVPTDDRTRLHAFLFGYDGRSGDVDVDLEDFGAELAQVATLDEAIAGTLDPVLGMQGLYPDRVRHGHRKNLEARLLQIARLARSRFTDPAATPKLRRACRRLLHEADQVDAEIAAWMHERIRATSYRFSEHYQESFLLAEVGVRGACLLCGATLSERRLRHVMRPSVRRTELLCRMCGGIADTPEPRLLVLVRMDQRQARGTSAAVTVELVNHTGRVREGYCLAAVRRSARYRIGQPDPVRRVTVGTGETATVRFRFEWDGTMPDHQYDMHAAFVAQTELYLGRRDFWLGKRETDAR